MTTENDLVRQTIGDLAPLIREGRISPVELTEFYLSRIEKLNPVLNAYQTVTATQALASARTAEREISAGKYRGPLHGIPVSIKDNIMTRGIVTTAGSNILADWVPEYDATVVARLRECGAILLGKTNMHEWASGGTTINPYYGTTRNPWNTERIAGGSSGGSAAAVAADLCLASIGTDNAGSVRNPAAMCGIVGLKPTYGRISVFGGVPGTGGYSTNHFGILTKTVIDCSIVLQELAGRDPLDALSSDQTVPDYTSQVKGEVDGKTFGLIDAYYDDLLWGEAENSFSTALQALESLGMRQATISIPHQSLIPAVQQAISRVENVSAHEGFLRSRPRDYSPELLYRHIHALTIPAVTYVAAQKARRLLSEEFTAALKKVDVIVTPVSLPAPTIEDCKKGYTFVEGKKLNFQGPRGNYWMLGTLPFNVVGLPAICVCCGFSSAGLPVAMQIVGAPFDEATVFQVAHAYERRTGWYQRKPQPVP